MTDSEIIKALECCVNNQHCWLCVLKDREDDCHDILKSALDLINRQQAEIERLNIDLKAMRGAANSYKAHYEDLKSENLETIKILKTAKSAIVKEFAEKLKKLAMAERICVEQGRYVNISYVNVCDIDRLVEEMGCNDG